MDNISEWIEQACNRGGMPHLLPELRFEFSERMTTTRGMAYTQIKLIKFSAPLFRLSSPDEQRLCVFHEIGHVIANWQGGTHRQAGHGCGWLAIMAKMGYPNAPRCHSITQLRKIRSTTIVFTCKCGTLYHIGKKTQDKISGGLKCKCRKCKRPITKETLECV